ncbi:MAG: ribosome-associated translation inhibitor RaiA [Ignavibacteria bacterium]|nr:ribosome-associated translation inhibitor RaiA [Ignavibacteria bacterium]
MKVTITARKFKARDTLKDYINGELEALEKFGADIHDVEVVLSFQHNKESIKEAEIIVKIPGHVITAKETSEEFEKSVRDAVEKIERQLDKIKTKKTPRHTDAELEKMVKTDDND